MLGLHLGLLHRNHHHRKLTAMTWTDHADYLDSLADEHRDDPAPKPYAPAPITWRITWTALDSFGDEIDHERIVLANPPNVRDYTENNTAAACPEGMRQWAEWVGTCNYGTDLARITYSIETLTDLRDVTFDQYSTPRLRTPLWSTTTIHEDRYQ